ncbi:MAG: endonuclease domain-containing protein [Anaerolineaceae bacterium]|nr:endonuclease domain-containing protein [Anaerolineaceae bacterium]
MHRRTDPQTYSFARELRKAQTKAEQTLWQVIRFKQINGIRFRRQHAIGPYIVDFCSPSKKLIIEVDGGQHLEQKEYDAQRTEFLQSKGYRVLRFWNNDVMNNLEGVIQEIIQTIDF